MTLLETRIQHLLLTGLSGTLGFRPNGLRPGSRQICPPLHCQYKTLLSKWIRKVDKLIFKQPLIIVCFSTCQQVYLCIAVTLSFIHEAAMIRTVLALQPSIQ